MASGTVKWFNPTKGYGFIQPSGGGKDVFVHISAVERAGLSTLNEGQAVEYEIVSNRGKEFSRKSEDSVSSAGHSRMETVQITLDLPVSAPLAATVRALEAARDAEVEPKRKQALATVTALASRGLIETMANPLRTRPASQ